MNRSEINVACHQCRVTNAVCHESGELRNGLLTAQSVMNVVFYEYGLLWRVVSNEGWFIMNGTDMNVLCNEWVCNEFGLLWTWSVMKGGMLWRVICYEGWSVLNVVCHERGLSWTRSVMNTVCYERGLLWTRSVLNAVCYERGLLWTWSLINMVCYERAL